MVGFDGESYGNQSVKNQEKITSKFTNWEIVEVIFVSYLENISESLLFFVWPENWKYQQLENLVDGNFNSNGCFPGIWKLNLNQMSADPIPIIDHVYSMDS